MPGRAPPMTKVCPCGRSFTTRDGDRYCRYCARIVVSRMRRAHYLSPLEAEAPADEREDHGDGDGLAVEHCAD